MTVNNISGFFHAWQQSLTSPWKHQFSKNHCLAQLYFPNENQKRFLNVCVYVCEVFESWRLFLTPKYYKYFKYFGNIYVEMNQSTQNIATWVNKNNKKAKRETNVLHKGRRDDRLSMVTAPLW